MERGVLSNVTSSHLNKKRQSMMPTLLKTGSLKGQVHGKPPRMSLGPGTLAARRPSLGGSMAGGASKSKPRHSMLPSQNNRRRKSSVGGSNYGGRKSNAFGTMVLKNDPRPVSNKGFMHASIRKLIEFLSEHNYDHPISPKILSRPTGKDFQNILQFLFLLVDRNLKFGQKFTDDVVTIFKGLRYPFSISKTALSAVGSLHTWPPLLASLTWLMELLECHELESAKEMEMREENGDKMFFEYLRKAYQSFLCGDDDMSAELDNELIGTFEDRDAEIEEQTRVLTSQREELMAELDSMKNSKSSMPALISQKKDFQEDLGKFQDLVKKLKEHKETLESKVRASDSECNERKAELNDIQNAKARLQKQLDDQELSLEDAEKILAEQADVEKQQDEINNSRQEMEKMIWDIEMKISKKLENLEKICQKYNGIASKLKIVPKSALNSRGVDFEVNLNLSGFNSGRESLVSTNVKVLQKSLNSLRDSAISKTNEVKTESMELQDTVEKNEDEKAELKSAIRDMEQQLNELEKESISQKRGSEKEREQVAEKMNEHSQKLNNLKESDKSFENLESTTFQLRQIEKEFQDEKLEFDKREAELDTYISTTLVTIVAQKQEIEESIISLLEHQQEEMNTAFSVTQEATSQLTNLVNCD